MEYHTIRARSRPTSGEVRPEAGTPTRCARYQAHRATIRAAVQGRAQRVGTMRRLAARPLTADRSRATSPSAHAVSDSGPGTRCHFATWGPQPLAHRAPTRRPEVCC